MAHYPDPQAAAWESAKLVDENLRRTLGGDDEFWPLWKPYLDRVQQSS
jgi:hypothetical protein